MSSSLIEMSLHRKGLVKCSACFSLTQQILVIGRLVCRFSSLDLKYNVNRSKPEVKTRYLHIFIVSSLCFVFVRMVASYLVHHSYCATAEAFAKSTDQAVHEELASIKNRQSESFCVGTSLNDADTRIKLGGFDSVLV